MSINWDDVQKAIYPMKEYEEVGRRLQESFAYPFVRETFNFALPVLAAYTGRLLEGDARGRYKDYAAILKRICAELHQADVPDMRALMAQVETREQIERFTVQSGVHASEIAGLLKYLIYWIVPMKKPLIGLVKADPDMRNALNVLRGVGVRANLDLLQQGRTTAGRKSLADDSGLPAAMIATLVNLSDFSRMPWASKATIANIMGAGYGSLAQLAAANPEQLYADFLSYGKRIGRNLKIGNEIESSYRIAQIVPVLLDQ